MSMFHRLIESLFPPHCQYMLHSHSFYFYCSVRQNIRPYQCRLTYKKIIWTQLVKESGVERERQREFCKERDKNENGCSLNVTRNFVQAKQTNQIICIIHSWIGSLCLDYIIGSRKMMKKLSFMIYDGQYNFCICAYHYLTTTQLFPHLAFVFMR